MKKIKLLENNMINKIAAGEVVERPSSVIKELVENSIDAGASIITIEVKDGGLSLMRVSDNGRGIPEEDVQNVFLRHATSKIENIDDLENVLTLGFRGEAMSSISAVSQLEMVTKSNVSNVGTHIEMHGGEIIKNQNIGAANGTSIIVRNLFYNIPARRKFLKKPGTESSYISDMVHKFALGNPDVSFKYILNGKKILDINAKGNLKTSIFHIYGKDISKSLLDLNYSSNNLLIDGYIGKPEIYKSNRSNGIFFVNGRFIKNQLVQSAVEEAFKTKLPTGKFPFYVLKLTIAPNLVDVNVHPTKLEIKFSNEDEIYDLVLQGVESTLNGHILIPKYSSPEYNTQDYQPERNLRSSEVINKLKEEAYIVEEVQEDILSLAERNKKTLPLKHEKKFYIKNVESENEDPMYISEDRAPIIVKKSEEEPEIEENKAPPFFRNYKIVGQFLNTYWAVEQHGSLYLIDQHAAHERVLYEEFMKKYKKSGIVSQVLLQPKSLNLSLTEKQIFYDNKEIFEKLGFDIEVFGEDSFAIKSVPFIFKEGISPLIFIEILEKLSSIEIPSSNASIDNIYDIKLDNIASFACKAAVKANDKLDYIEAKTLIEKMLTIENPFTCPHGRPTIIELTKYELEKMFKRVK